MRGPSARATRTLALLAATLAAACSRVETPPSAASPAALRQAAAPAPAVDEALLLVQELMDWVVEPAAGVVFAAVGRRAPPDRRPAGAAAWQAVADAAERLGEQAAWLAQPALAAHRSDWQTLAGAMRLSAAEVGAAARAQDAERAAQASDALRAACQGCHLRYAAAVAQRVGDWPARP